MRLLILWIVKNLRVSEGNQRLKCNRGSSRLSLRASANYRSLRS